MSGANTTLLPDSNIFILVFLALIFFFPKVLTKVLTTRLKELQDDGLVDKREISMNPRQIEYHLTPRGIALNRVIIELAIFSIEQYLEEVFSKVPDSFDEAITEARSRFEGPVIT